jgi:hypothetical protein
VQIDRTGLVSASYTDQQSNTVTDSLRVTVLNVSTEPTPPETPTDSSDSPPACCGAAGPVSPLGLAAGMVLVARRNRRRHK